MLSKSTYIYQPIKLASRDLYTVVFKIFVSVVKLTISWEPMFLFFKLNFNAKISNYLSPLLNYVKYTIIATECCIFLYISYSIVEKNFPLFRSVGREILNLRVVPWNPIYQGLTKLFCIHFKARVHSLSKWI